MPTFPTPGPIAATVQVAGAQVRVAVSERSDTVVLVEPINPASPRDVKVANRTKVDFTGGRLSVKTTVSGAKNGSIAITIDLPAGSSLIAYLAHSDVHVDGSLGECELHLASGRVLLDQVDEVQANIAAGQVTIGRLAGAATIDGGAAAVRIGEVSGASVTARTANGAIRIGRMIHGRAELSNSSGNIEVGISAGSTVQLDADSTRGQVLNSVAAQGNPDPSDNHVTVHARTRHGDIVIHRAASRQEASVTATS